MIKTYISIIFLSLQTIKFLLHTGWSARRFPWRFYWKKIPFFSLCYSKGTPWVSSKNSVNLDQPSCWNINTYIYERRAISYRFYSAGLPTTRIKIRDYGIYSVISFYIQILASILLFIISLKTMYNLETEKWLISEKLPNPICENRLLNWFSKLVLDRV